MHMRKEKKSGTHFFGHTHKACVDPSRMYYFEQDGKLHAHQTKQEGVTYLGRAAVIKQFGRKELYRARGYKK